MRKSDLFSLLSVQSQTNLLNWANLPLLYTSVDKKDWQSALEMVQILARTGFITEPEAAPIVGFFQQQLEAAVVAPVEEAAPAYANPVLLESYRSESSWIARYQFDSGQILEVQSQSENEPSSSQWLAILNSVVSELGGAV